ncbi:hypothetical protein [Marivirga tractuosa]|uniref:Uncharacterized protein n=1 Tax=Marivirga tractuosa (strain ATCC 23168 / DSM 4126 / NBRC 15989 / NCIMB 1408 / VKM B-1430 / H-43) TaxID=643867 RepID=E4TKU6_MARTH|nr:hypothetical protein [Marivirga tractuosa]ADR22249.1 hypothetical protein Ftrac_2270 [Marivirga tractuosa DSM 4126]
MNKELIIQTIVITSAIIFPFITGFINSKKQQKQLVYQRVNS